MKGMILAAGFGTRLLPLTRILPKPIFPVLNRPLLAHTIGLLRTCGIRDIAVNVHHLSEKIIERFPQSDEFGGNLRFSKEDTILGTGGGIKALQNFLEDGPFFVINSDIIVDIDLARVIEFHKKNKASITLVVRDNAEQHDPIEIDQHGRVTRFGGNISANARRIQFTGIQIIEPEIFSRIPPGKFCGTTDSIFPQMVAEGRPIYAYVHGGYWIDMGNREHYLKAHEDALDGRVVLKSGPSHSPDGPLIVPPVLIGRDCNIAKDTQIGPYAVLGNGCDVRHGAIIEHSVCWDKVTIGAGATVRASVLAHQVTIADNEEVTGQSLIALETQKSPK